MQAPRCGKALKKMNEGSFQVDKGCGVSVWYLIFFGG
jgi:hypothetical protein